MSAASRRGRGTRRFARASICNDRFARDKERLGTLEGDLKTLTTLVTQLAELVKFGAQNTKDQEARLRELEQRPVKKYDALWGMVAGAVISGIIGALSKLL